MENTNRREHAIAQKLKTTSEFKKQRVNQIQWHSQKRQRGFLSIETFNRQV